MRRDRRTRPPRTFAAPEAPPSDRALTPQPAPRPEDPPLESRVRPPFPAAPDTDLEC